MIATLLLAALVGLLIGGVGDAAINRWRLRRRVAAMPRRLVPIVRRGQSAAAPILRESDGRRDAALVRVLPGGARLQARLAAAGGQMTVSALCGGAAVVAVLLAVTAAWAGLSVVPAVVAGVAGAAAAAMFGTAAAVRRRRAAFQRGFPDALAVIIRSLRAGLPVPVAIIEAGRGGNDPAAAAFARIAEEMRLGQSLEAALWAAAARVGLADFDFLVVTIGVQREAGGNLAETLAGLDDTLRMRRQLALKVRAMAAEARASTMIIGSLPFAMGVLV